MINLDIPARFRPVVAQGRQVAEQVFRPNSRKYDREEHSYPVELDLIAALNDGMTAAGGGSMGASTATRQERDPAVNRNGANMATVIGIAELCRGDVGLLLSIPRQGLGNAAVAATATAEQKERFGGLWVAMAITEPGAGSDSAAIRTTATRDGDDYLLNGEKIYVTAGERADALVVWATLDKAAGRAAIKPFLVEKTRPGITLDRLEHKLGIRASDTAAFRLENCRVPAANLLGSPEIDTEKGFGGVMATFDNTRPLVASMAVGLTRAVLDETTRILKDAGVTADWLRPAHAQPAAAAALLEMEADYEAARLLTLKAAWMADNGRPNALEASQCKAKAGRTATDVALRCVALCGSIGYGEGDLLEKWARDAKILDIFEGTQQIQLLIIARRLLGKSSQELR